MHQTEKSLNKTFICIILIVKKMNQTMLLQCLLMKVSHAKNIAENSTANRHENRGVQQLKTVYISLDKLQTLHANICTNVQT